MTRLDFHAREIAAVVAKCNQAGDAKVHLVDTAFLRPAPNVLGQALLGGLIAVEARRAPEQE